jgi:hypothetical protein
MKIVKILFINLILIVIALIISEIFLRNFSKFKIQQISKENFYEFNKELGWTFLPNISKTFYNPNKIGIRVNTNEDGFRDKKILRNHNKKKILFIGDSMTAALQVEENERFSELLGNKLDYESYNLAINGYATDQALIVLKKYIEKIHPDIIFYYLVHNDFYLNGEHFLRSGFGDIWSKPVLNENFEIVHAYLIPKKFEIKSFLLNHFAIVRLFSQLKTFLFSNIFINKEIFFTNKEIFKQFYFDDEDKIEKFEVFKKLMKEMKKIAKQHNSTLIVSRGVNIIDVSFEIQKIGQENSKNIYNINDIYSDYNNKINFFFDENEILNIPIDEYNFNQDNIKKIIFYDKNNKVIDGHYTKFGHEYVAKTMYKFIKNYAE